MNQTKQKSMTNFYPKSQFNTNLLQLRSEANDRIAIRKVPSDNALFSSSLKGKEFVDSVAEIEDFKTKGDGFFKQ